MTDAVTITGIAAGGDGVGRLADGRVVFVPRTAPGDRVVLGRRVTVHKHFARGDAAELVAAGSARVAAPCPHYARDRCGDCQLQHLAYDTQLETKRALVGDALRRIGKLDCPDPEIVEAIAEWRYRAKLSVVPRPPSRSRGDEGGTRTLGLHPYDRPGAVFPLVDCHVADFRLMDLWRALRSHLDLLPRGLSRLTLRLDRAGGRHVIVESTGEPWPDAEALQAQLGGDERVTWWWQPVDGAARVVARGPGGGAPAPTPRPLPHASAAFAEANPEMSALARAWAVERVRAERGLVWDLYGGSGATAALLAERGAQVVSVDSDERAVAWGRELLGDGVRFVAARVEDVLHTLPPPMAVVAAPPAVGLHWNVTLWLREHPVGRLAYISSDPATLARDLQRLSTNYRLAALRAFDVLPQTAHVDAVAILEAV